MLINIAYKPSLQLVVFRRHAWVMKPHTRSTAFTHSGIARKAIVALTGLVLAGWMLLHAAGSLGVFAGPKVMNDYANLLRATGLLWVMRAGLALSVLAHAWLAL